MILQKSRGIKLSSHGELITMRRRMASLTLVARTAGRRPLKAFYRNLVRGLRRAGVTAFASGMIDVDGLLATTREQKHFTVQRRVYEEPRRSSISVPAGDPIPPLENVRTTLSLLDISDPGFSFRNGYLVDPSRRVVYEQKVLPLFDSLRVGLTPLEQPRRLQGSVACLWTSANYGHWLLYALPLIQYYRSYLRSDPDYYYVGAPARGYQLESLEMLGIPRKRIVEHAVQADRLLAAIPDRQGGYDADLLLFADRALRPAARPRQDPGRRLFVSRASAEHRRLLNEADCAAALQDVYGVELVATEEMALADEIDLFRTARLVVGAHGAGLSNIVFAPAGTRLVELTSTSYWSPPVAEIAALKRQPHALLRGRLGRFQLGLPREWRDFEIDVSRLVEVVGAALAPDDPSG
jgi:glycosyl transferase family 61